METEHTVGSLVHNYHSDDQQIMPVNPTKQLRRLMLTASLMHHVKIPHW
jgi:hypothetical protein